MPRRFVTPIARHHHAILPVLACVCFAVCSGCQPQQPTRVLEEYTGVKAHVREQLSEPATLKATATEWREHPVGRLVIKGDSLFDGAVLVAREPRTSALYYWFDEPAQRLYILWSPRLHLILPGFIKCSRLACYDASQKPARTLWKTEVCGDGNQGYPSPATGFSVRDDRSVIAVALDGTIVIVRTTDGSMLGYAKAPTEDVEFHTIGDQVVVHARSQHRDKVFVVPMVNAPTRSPQPSEE